MAVMKGAAMSGRVGQRASPAGMRPDEGFTLVEVLVALVIFVIASTAAITLIIRTLDVVRGNSDRILAANIARSQIEELRAKGTARIPIGQSTGGIAGTNANFTVNTTANWVGIGQTESSCAAANPGQDFLRVTVEVSGPNVSVPQVADAIVFPDATVDTGATGAVAISIVDQVGNPVSGVTVTATDQMHPTNAFSLVSGTDGCLFVPRLTPSSSLAVAVARQGFVPSTPTGASATMAVTKQAVERKTFHYAAASAITFASLDGDYPLPARLPVSWQLNATGNPVQPTTLDATITGLWPLPTGFTAWAGGCTDADPQSYSAARQSFALSAGATTTAQLAAAPLFLRGLPAGESITAHYIGIDGACAPPDFVIGRTDSRGQLNVGMPYGRWQFTAAGETVQPVDPLTPQAAAAGALRLDFTKANLDGLGPTPSPTPSTSIVPSPGATP